MTNTAAIIGGGPAGLMAAEVLAEAGLAVTVYDRMPSVGRKLLMAGRGGLNLTHAEPLDRFLSRYSSARARIEPIIRAFPPEALISWCEALGQPTFVGSSDRVFPRAMKASPLLRAWLRRLDGLGVTIATRHHWTGWDDAGRLVFDQTAVARPSVTVLAAGGASWPRLGSDGAWTSVFPGHVRHFVPSNCGFVVDWSPHLRARFAGRPLKRIALRFGETTVRGEATITENGLEGGAVYALSGRLRDAIEVDGSATVSVDLRPDLTVDELDRRLSRSARSLSNTLRKQAGLSPEAVGLVQEALHSGATGGLPALIKAVPVRLIAPAPIERAISSAGGLRWDAVDERLMLRDRPGVFAAGEMLDWEAPTGGYLLQACFASGVAAAKGALAYLA